MNDPLEQVNSNQCADGEVSLEVNRIISSVTKCVDRGVDPVSGKRGKCHVFLDHNDLCQCEDVDLTKWRMK